MGRNLGLHVRAEGIRHDEYSEVMLQYAILGGHKMENGIGVFAQLNLPTGAVETDKYKGLFGVSGRVTVQDILTWDGNIHYDPDEEMLEHERPWFSAPMTLSTPSLRREAMPVRI